MDSLFDALKNMGASRLAAMLLTFFSLVIFFIYIALRSNTPGMTMLYSDLSSADATEITAKLSISNIEYRLNQNGTQIDVPQQDVGKARMLLAQEGLPRRGSIGYEIFDKKQSFGTTTFEQNINKVRALEGELARTIGTIDNIRNARVHLVLPERKLFSRESNPASASVFLNLNSNSVVTKEQLQAIQHLVAASVPNLKASKVAIIDQSGNLLAKDEEEDNTGVNSIRNSDDMKANFEHRMARNIDEVISKIVGYGKVRTTVNAEMSFDVVNRNSEIYDPDGQVARSTQTTTEENIDNSSLGNSNQVSVNNSLPGLNAAAEGTPEAVGVKNNRTEEVTNYEITKTIESVVKSTGDIQKLSVAVIVDGTYETDPNAVKPADAAKDWIAPRIYKTRSAEEMAKIEKLVKTAIGYDKDRGDTVEVINMQFAEDLIRGDLLEDDSKLMGFYKADLIGIAETLTLSIVAVLVIFLVLKPLATHLVSSSSRRQSVGLAEEQAIAYSQQAQLAPPKADGSDGAMPNKANEPSELEQMIDMNQVEGRVKASSVQRITELVDNHPGETVSVIRSWLAQEN